ncbi:MAG: caspase family protein, partial [bacterium]
MLRKHLICYLLVSLLLVPVLRSQERAATRPSIPGGPKQALVIGNSAYTHTSPLKNPVNDAKSIGNTLQQLGFEVTTLLDVNQRQMEQALRRFGSRLRDQNGVGLFYYAGHGMQVSGENYLLPVDINPSTETDVRYDAIPVGKLLGQMDAAGNGMNIVILDACRNNPFARSFRSESRGLAQVIAPTGSFISYATAPGDVAADGDGDNGLFTAKLLTHMRTPGLKLEEVFKRVRADVQRESNDKQVPWDSSSVTGDFFFVPPVEEVVVSAPTEQPSTEASKLDIAERAWSMIEQSENPEIFRAFIEKFPDTPQRQLAELKLMLLPSDVDSSEPEISSSEQVSPTNPPNLKNALPNSNKVATETNSSINLASGENERYRWTPVIVEDKQTKRIWQRQDNGERTFEWAKSYCEGLRVGGDTNWRLPEIGELRELLGASDSRSDGTSELFNELRRGSYWSGTLLSNARVRFQNPWDDKGGITARYGKDSKYTLCVSNTTISAPNISSTTNLYASKSSEKTDLRNPQKEKKITLNPVSGANERYRWTPVIVEDKQKKLIWQRQDNGERTFEWAKSYCEGLRVGGDMNWRLPEIGELRELLGESDNRSDGTSELFNELRRGSYWSGALLNNARVRFQNPWDDKGGIAARYGKDARYTLCVRSSDGSTPKNSSTVNLYSSNSSSKTDKNEIQSSFQKGMEYSSYQKISESTGKVIGCGFFHVGCEEKALTFPGYQSDFHLKGYRRVNLWGKDRPWTDT